MNFCNFHSINDLLSDSKITQDSLLHKKKKKIKCTNVTIRISNLKKFNSFENILEINSSRKRNARRKSRVLEHRWTIKEQEKSMCSNSQLIIDLVIRAN